MKIIFILSAFFVLFISSPVIAQTYIEEEFIVEGEPVYTETVPRGPTTVVPPPTPAVVITTPGAPVLIPAEQDVYIGMSKYHVREVLGPPTYVEKFRRFTRRHHGIYDEVWTYASPTGNLVLYMKERRVQKIGHE